MKNYWKNKRNFLLLVALTGIFISCKESSKNEVANNLVAENYDEPTSPKKSISDEFKKYWYAGKAEITSYNLKQSRYGELRDGNAVLIFVTEPFSAEKQVKSDKQNASNIPILKLNSTKNYLTGIYPYSIMTSSFYPVYDDSHALKVSFSAQEWCGQVYAQLNNKESFEVQSHSYFESEGDQNFKLEKTFLEDEIWNKIRINPSDLPTGDLKMIPSFENVRVYHKTMKAYRAQASLTDGAEGLKVYRVYYPEAERTLTIRFNKDFPFSIESWEEISGNTEKKVIVQAQKIKRIITPYWQQNSNSDLFLRDSLGL